MRLLVTLAGERPLSLPLHYNHLLQGFLYSQLEPNLARWLHGEAYRYAERTYRMFTFSRLSGPYTLEQKTKRITFTDLISFQLASHNADVLASLAEHLLKSEALRLGQHEVAVRGVEILKPPTFTNKPLRVKALTPITIYSTFDKPAGGKVTHYYAPHDKDWSSMLVSNLLRKAKSLGWEKAEHDLADANISAIKVSPKDKKVVRYKGFVMEGWTGVYELALPVEYQQLAYDVGLGSRNPIGMGMVEAI